MKKSMKMKKQKKGRCKKRIENVLKKNIE